jgi:hypothetical protein
LHKLVSAITMTQAKEFYILNEAFLSGFLDEGQLKRLREVRVRFIVRVEVIDTFLKLLKLTWKKILLKTLIVVHQLQL